MSFTAGTGLRLAEMDGGTGMGPSDAVRNFIAQLSTDDLITLLKELRGGRHEQSDYLHGLVAVILEELEVRDR
jgi:hypothetical protein